MSSEKKVEGKSKPIAIRLSDSDYQLYEDAMKSLGMTNKSEFFRSLINDRFDPEKMNKVNDKNLAKMLFYYNKSSNNLNQLAKSVNTSMKDGTINQNTGIKILAKLDLISESFLNGIRRNKND